MQRKVVMLGASGAVGGRVARLLQDKTYVQRLTLINRRVLDGFSAQVQQHIADVEQPASYASHLAGHDDAICCLGVGEPSKVSREEFIRIDQTAVIAFAKACKEAGIKHFELLSAVDANAKSSNYYLRSKGQLQEAILAMGFESVSFFQPSMILTPTNRYGMSQAIMLAVWPSVSKLMLGGLRKYRGIQIDKLSQAMAAQVVHPNAGTRYLQWDQFQQLTNAI